MAHRAPLAHAEQKIRSLFSPIQDRCVPTSPVQQVHLRPVASQLAQMFGRFNAPPPRRPRTAGLPQTRQGGREALQCPQATPPFSQLV